MNGSFENPPDTTHLWRYMDVGRFLAFIQSKALYFARLRELGDPWEGAHPLSLIEKLKLWDGERGNLTEMLKGAAQVALVSCWHENDFESVAMWSLYTAGREGVAICTTCGRLRTALQGQPHDTFLSRVRYIDYEDKSAKIESQMDALRPLLLKRKAYEHEREVRAVIRIGPMQPIPFSFERGTLIPVDLQLLLQRIVVAPTYPEWGIKALQNVIESAGLKVTVEKSSLIRTPEQLIQSKGAKRGDL